LGALLGIPKVLANRVFFRGPRSFGVENELGMFELLSDVGKEDLVVLEIFGPRFASVPEILSLAWGCGAELEVRLETFGLPANDAGILMELPVLDTFSFVFLVSCDVATSANAVAESFTGLGVAMPLSSLGYRDARVRCLFTVPVGC
jgi:hypothetical protein